MVMTKVNVFEVKAKLSEYLDRADAAANGSSSAGTTSPWRSCAPSRTSARSRDRSARLPGRPTFQVPASFFEPLPDEELDLWEGVTSTDPLSSAWTPRPGAVRRRSRRPRPHTVRRGDARARPGARRPVVRLLLDTCTFLWLAGGSSLSAPRGRRRPRSRERGPPQRGLHVGDRVEVPSRTASAPGAARSADPHRASPARRRRAHLRRGRGAAGDPSSAAAPRSVRPHADLAGHRTQPGDRHAGPADQAVSDPRDLVIA